MLSLKVSTKILCFISKDQIHPISAKDQVMANSFTDAAGGMLDILVSSDITEYHRLVGLNDRHLLFTVCRLASPRSRCQQEPSALLTDGFLYDASLHEHDEGEWREGRGE